MFDGWSAPRHRKDSPVAMTLLYKSFIGIYIGI
jgi:hypothetical protein